MYINKEERKFLKSLLQSTYNNSDSIIEELKDEEENITVEVDGEIIADTITDTDDVKNIELQNKDALEGHGAKLGITDMLLSAVTDENEAIQFYNSLIASCVEEGFDEIANIIKHISEEENIHIGMLQHAMATISEQAKSIKDGEEEAEQIIDDLNGSDSNDDSDQPVGHVEDATDNIKD